MAAIGTTRSIWVGVALKLAAVSASGCLTATAIGTLAIEHDVDCRGVGKLDDGKELQMFLEATG